MSPSSFTRFLFVLIVVTLFSVVIACGGGHSNNNTAGNTPNPGTPNPGGAGTTGSGGTTTGGTTTSGSTTGGSATGGTTSGTTSGGTGTTTGGSTGGSTGGGTTGTTTGGGTGNGITAPKFVYAMNGTAGTNSGVAEFRIDPSTGVLSLFGAASVPVTNTSEGGMAATPQTGFVYVAQWFTKTIAVLRADPNSGALTESLVVSVPELQSSPNMMTDPAGKFLFAADPNGFQIFVFSIQASGDLSPVPGSPFKISQSPQWLTVDANGKFLFATAGNQVFGFTVASNGVLTPTPGSPVTVRPAFVSIGKGQSGVRGVIDPGARFLFFCDAINPVMYVYRVAPDGALTPVAGSPFNSGTISFAPAVDPSGRFVFTGGAVVAALSVNQTTGELTPVSGSPFDNGPFRSGGAPVFDTTVDPSGRFLLLADTEQSKITVFSIDQNSGVLTNVDGSPFPVATQPIGGGSPSSVAVTH